MSDDLVIKSIEKNSRETIRVSVGTFKSYPLISVRVFAETSNGEATPTQKGLALRPDLVPQVIEALTEAHRHMSREHAANG